MTSEVKQRPTLVIAGYGLKLVTKLGYIGLRLTYYVTRVAIFIETSFFSGFHSTRDKGEGDFSVIVKLKA